MANESLATYLNDHLAGSVVALELLDHLEEGGAGTEPASMPTSRPIVRNWKPS